MKAIHREKYPSLSFNWVAKKLRQLPLPLLYVCEDLSYGGLYFQPTKEEHIWKGNLLPPSNGIIMVGCYAEQPTESALAHEFRHHWQYWNGIDSDCVGWNTETTYEEYPKDIVRYFTGSTTEMDALNFELKHAPSDLSLEWMNWIKK